jgi:hypothetical protein
MPDLNKSIQNHHAEMESWWKKPEYVKARKEFVKRNPICVRCGRKCQTPGHSHDDYVHGYEHYLQQVRNDACDPLCNSCNHAESRGLKPCPVCVKEKCRKIRYISPYGEYCYDHRPVEEVRQSEDRKEAFKQLVKQSHSIQNARRRKLYQEMRKK